MLRFGHYVENFQSTIDALFCLKYKPTTFVDENHVERTKVKKRPNWERAQTIHNNTTKSIDRTGNLVIMEQIRFNVNK